MFIDVETEGMIQCIIINDYIVDPGYFVGQYGYYMANDDVYSKYPVVNNDWEFHKNPDDIKIPELWGTSLVVS